MPSTHPRRSRGFTLVEALVALFVMALLSALAWQGLGAVLQGREASRGAVDRAGRLATVLAQWEQDLQAVVDTGTVPALHFDGQTLRMTRRADTGVVLVAWALREGVWQRWVSPPYTQAAPLQEAWMASQQFQGREAGQLELFSGAEQWQLYYFYDGNWANAQSTGNLVGQPAQTLPPPEQPASPPDDGQPPPAPPPAQLRQELPAAVRLVLTLDGHKLQRDIALAPAG